MADGAPGKICFYILSFESERSICLGITRAQIEVFPQARHLMCWAHVARKCREHRKLVSMENWRQIDTDIHNLQFCFSDIIFNHGTQLLMNKWSADSLRQQFQSYFFNQWILTLPLWQENF